MRYASGAVGDPFGNFNRTVTGERIDLFTPSNFNYVFPMKPGATWDLKTYQENGARQFDLAIKLTVGAEVEVETPAGKFRALRVERETRWKQRGNSNAGVHRMTYWYSAAAKRFVRMEQTNTTGDGKTFLKERFELAAYQVR